MEESDALATDDIELTTRTDVSAGIVVELAAGVIDVNGVDSGTTDSGRLITDDAALDGKLSDVVEIDGVSSNVELTIEPLAEVVLIAAVLMIETELSTAEVEDVSEGDTGRVVLVALVGTTTGSVVLVLSVLGVIEVVLLVRLVVLTDVEVGSTSVVDVVGMGMGIGGVEGVVEVDGVVDTSIMVVGVFSIRVDDSELLRSVSLSGNGDGGVWNGVLVADCVPFVTIMRLTCFRRYLGLSAPPCPAGAAAAAGLQVARTARDAAKTIDDLRTIAMTGYINIIRSIIVLIDVASLNSNELLI